MNLDNKPMVKIADSAPHLLLIDDDKRIRTLLSQYLTENGFRITSAETAEIARQKMQMLEFDLMVLDVMLPGESGIQFATSFREDSEVPILMLSARSEMSDRILGLESGVDDYLPKPFEPRELLLRINAILKRKQRPSAERQENICFGPYKFNIERRILKQDEEVIRLTEREGEILAMFANRIGETIDRQEIIKSIRWMENRSIDVQINRLRKKIEVNPKKPEFLQTVRGSGYRFFIE